MVNKSSIQSAEMQPYIYVFRPPAVVAVGAAVQVSRVNGPRAFVWTEIGFTSTPVGIPARGQPFNVFIQNVGRQVFFQSDAFNLLAFIGANPYLNDQPSKAMPVPWTWDANGQMVVDFTNVGTLPCIPALLLIGYLVTG